MKKKDPIRTNLGAAVRIPSRALMEVRGSVCEILLMCGGVHERLVVSQAWVDALRSGKPVIVETLREWKQKGGEI